MPKKLKGRVALVLGCMFILRQTSVKMAVLLYKQAMVPFIMIIAVCLINNTYTFFYKQNVTLFKMVQKQALRFARMRIPPKGPYGYSQTLDIISFEFERGSFSKINFSPFLPNFSIGKNRKQMFLTRFRRFPQVHLNRVQTTLGADYE